MFYVSLLEQSLISFYFHSLKVLKTLFFLIEYFGTYRLPVTGHASESTGLNGYVLELQPLQFLPPPNSSS